MPPVEPFEYDAFISYENEDRPWAKRLADELGDRGLTIFLDRDSLRVGEGWREQLDTAIDASQHIIVLWSENAKKSEYVSYERFSFDIKARDSRANSNKPSRVEIAVLLDESVPKVLDDKQMIPDLREPGAYMKGPDDAEPKRGLDNIDPNVWNRVVRRVDKTIRDNSNALRILVAVLASNKESIRALDFDWKYPYIGTLNSVLPEMGIKSKEDLLEFYGAKPNEWRPFGDRINIWTVLDNLGNAVRKATGGKVEIEWEPIGDNLWSDDIEAAKREAARLVRGLSVVLIDPISLVDEAVSSALDRVEDCFVNPRSAVMVLTPFKMLAASASLRKLVEARANSFATRFYQPPVPPPTPAANFGAGVGDVTDMQRLVLLTLGQYYGTRKGANNWTNL